MPFDNFEYSSKEYVFFVMLHTLEPIKHFADHSIPTLIASELEYRFSNKEIILFCYCIMPDHLHILLSLGESHNKSLKSWIRAFKNWTEKIAKEQMNIENLWHRDFYDDVVRKEESLPTIAEYIINNPVRQGLIEEWGKYPYIRAVKTKKTLTL